MEIIFQFLNYRSIQGPSSTPQCWRPLPLPPYTIYYRYPHVCPLTKLVTAEEIVRSIDQNVSAIADTQLNGIACDMDPISSVGLFLPLSRILLKQSSLSRRLSCRLLGIEVVCPFTLQKFLAVLVMVVH